MKYIPLRKLKKTNMRPTYTEIQSISSPQYRILTKVAWVTITKWIFGITSNFNWLQSRKTNIKKRFKATSVRIHGMKQIVYLVASRPNRRCCMRNIGKEINIDSPSLKISNKNIPQIFTHSSCPLKRGSGGKPIPALGVIRKQRNHSLQTQI